MTERDFQAALRAADRKLADDGMPAAVDRRVRASLAAGGAPARRPRWLVIAGLPAVAAAAVALVLITARAQPDDRVAGFELVQRSADLRVERQADGVLAVVAGSATVHSDAGEMTIATRTPTRLRKQASGVRILAGTVDVSVTKRIAVQPPARVEVSHGAIEVMGTRFRVEQRADGGRVQLDDGRIVFIADDGRRRTLMPGDSLGWPLPPPTPARPSETPSEQTPLPPPVERPPRERVRRPPLSPPPSEPAAPHGVAAEAATPPTPSAPGREADRLLHDLAELRSRGQYREAAARIDQWLAEPGLGPAAREILSYELASIWTYQLADRVPACAALGSYLRTYPAGPHAADAQRAEDHLRCSALDPAPRP